MLLLFLYKRIYTCRNINSSNIFDCKAPSGSGISDGSNESSRDKRRHNSLTVTTSHSRLRLAFGSAPNDCADGFSPKK